MEVEVAEEEEVEEVAVYRGRVLGEWWLRWVGGVGWGAGARRTRGHGWSQSPGAHASSSPSFRTRLSH